MLPTDRLTILLTMACLSSSNRVCARVVQEKLCQFVVGKNYHHQQNHQQQKVVAVAGVGTGTGSGGSSKSVATTTVGNGGGVVGGKKTVGGGPPLFTALKSGGVGLGGAPLGASVEAAMKYGPSVGMFFGGSSMSINGVGSVRNFYSSSLVRNLFRKNQVSSGKIPKSVVATRRDQTSGQDT